MNGEETLDKLKTAKDRAEAYQQLANRARDRFESFRAYSIRLTFGLWTLFAASVAGVFMAPTGTITLCHVVVGVLFAVSLLVLFCWWLRWERDVSQRDNRVSYWWETHVWGLVDGTIPDQFQPHTSKGQSGDKWHSALVADRDAEIRRHANLGKRPFIHWINIGVTAALAVVFCVVLVGKFHAVPAEAPPQATITIEGGSIVADGTAKFKLGSEPAKTP